MHRFSDFAQSPLDGDKMSIDDLIDKEISVLKFNVKKSKFEGKLLTVQFELNGVKHVLMTGSGVLLQQLEDNADKLPFLATIQKIDKYYSFV